MILLKIINYYANLLFNEITRQVTRTNVLYLKLKSDDIEHLTLKDVGITKHYREATRIEDSKQSLLKQRLNYLQSANPKSLLARDYFHEIFSSFSVSDSLASKWNFA